MLDTPERAGGIVVAGRAAHGKHVVDRVVVVAREADLLHVVGALDRRAASRAAWTAGSKSAIRTAMMAITTSSSISVKPRLHSLGSLGCNALAEQPTVQIKADNLGPTSGALAQGLGKNDELRISEDTTRNARDHAYLNPFHNLTRMIDPTPERSMSENRGSIFFAKQ